MKKKTGIGLIIGTTVALAAGAVAIFLSDEKRRKKAQGTIKELWGKAEDAVAKGKKKFVQARKTSKK